MTGLLSSTLRKVLPVFKEIDFKKTGESRCNSLEDLQSVPSRLIMGLTMGPWCSVKKLGELTRVNTIDKAFRAALKDIEKNFPGSIDVILVETAKELERAKEENSVWVPLSEAEKSGRSYCYLKLTAETRENFEAIARHYDLVDYATGRKSLPTSDRKFGKLDFDRLEARDYRGIEKFLAVFDVSQGALDKEYPATCAFVKSPVGSSLQMRFRTPAAEASFLEENFQLFLPTTSRNILRDLGFADGSPALENLDHIRIEKENENEGLIDVVLSVDFEVSQRFIPLFFKKLMDDVPYIRFCKRQGSETPLPAERI